MRIEISSSQLVDGDTIISRNLQILQNHLILHVTVASHHFTLHPYDLPSKNWHQRPVLFVLIDSGVRIKNDISSISFFLFYEVKTTHGHLILFQQIAAKDLIK